MTPERLEEIEQILVDDGIYTCAVGELCDFARATLDAQPKPCAHERTTTTFYPKKGKVRYHQEITQCGECCQVLKIREERNPEEWTTVWQRDPAQIILNVPSKCQRCGQTCEVCTR